MESALRLMAKHPAIFRVAAQMMGSCRAAAMALDAVSAGPRHPFFPAS